MLDFKFIFTLSMKQDFLICFEMLLAAIAHLFAFSHVPFIDSTAASEPTFYSFMRTLDFTDERTDVNDHFRQICGLE
ncbi:proteasome subunit beta type-3-like protein [Leptotrombidium deliense]|uniref:Proteasome subunit beta type-3-like protein n=1 Tax=Leptotrombidium deliense TaxID=299467 RepID=A0A443S8X6_9ACAR|nr:proteasome subunit beta type-3-like protein [Leptotrombidium deliense]